MDRYNYISEFLSELLNEPCLQEYNITPQTSIKTLRRHIKHATSSYIPVRIQRLDSQYLNISINIEGSVTDVWKSIQEYYRERGVTVSIRYLKRNYDIEYQDTTLQPKRKLREYNIQSGAILIFHKKKILKSAGYMRRG